MSRKNVRILCLLSVLIALPSLTASAAERSAPARITEGDAGGWPHVAAVQVKHRLPSTVHTNEADGEGLVIEQNWGGCQGNSVCGLTNGSCYIRMYATCQDRLTGTGDPCQGC